jgi:hypothetical protein
LRQVMNEHVTVERAMRGRHVTSVGIGHFCRLNARDG